MSAQLTAATRAAIEAAMASDLVAFQVTPVRFPTVAPSRVCRCGRPARGDVDQTGPVPAHYCRQCSHAHCEMADHVLGRAVAS